MSRDVGDKLVKPPRLSYFVNIPLTTCQVQQAKRELALPSTLLPYETEPIQLLIRSVRDHNRHVQTLLSSFSPGTFSPSSDPAVACALLVFHLSMRRDKRCLLSYHSVRSHKLRSITWSTVEEQTDESAEKGNNNISPEEQAYQASYSDLLTGYKSHWTDVDLTGSLEPPRDLFVDVRVLKDAGEIMTEYGTLSLTRNSQFYVRLGDVQRLIDLGYLQRLS